MQTPIKSSLCKFFQYKKRVKLRKIRINNPLLFIEIEESLTTEKPLLMPQIIVSLQFWSKKYCMFINKDGIIVIEIVFKISFKFLLNFKKYKKTTGKITIKIILVLNDKTKKNKELISFFCLKKYNDVMNSVSGTKSS